jgi:5-methylcytosine-specific restriction endonuclease McrA
MALKPCLDCGRLAQGFRCQICATIRNRTNPYWTPAWRRLSAAVTAGDGACVDCGSTEQLDAHHDVARAEGGADAPENLVTLCAACHARLRHHPATVASEVRATSSPRRARTAPATRV